MDKKKGFKRVPAVDKCFALLDLFAGADRPLFVSEVARSVNYNKSTVYNLVHTLADLGVLENVEENRFRIGTRLYALGKAAGNGFSLISSVHPYLEEINLQTGLSVFFGIRSGKRAVILDKVDSSDDIRVSSEVGMKIPLLAGAGGKVLLSQLPDAAIDDLLSESQIKKFTLASCTDKNTYKAMIKRARSEGFAMDDEEYIEGIRALAVPLRLNRDDLQAAIWVVGLKSRIKDEVLSSLTLVLKTVAKKIETRFSLE